MMTAPSATTLPPAVRPKAGRLVRMMASTNDGEVLGAVRALGRILKSAGSSFGDLAEVIEAGRSGASGKHATNRPKDIPPTWRELPVVHRIALLQEIRSSWWPTLDERRHAVDVWMTLLGKPTFEPDPDQEAALNQLFAKAFARGTRP